MKVYTYYEEIAPGKSRHTPESQKELLEVWKRSWVRHGWEPVVLNRENARQHPGYAGFEHKFLKLPTQYGHAHQITSFMRWAAMGCTKGGGLLVDYDVMNYGFKPIEPEPNKLVVFCDEPPNVLFLGVMLATEATFDFVANEFADWCPGPGDFIKDSSEYLGMHCSDLSILKQLFERGVSWIEKRPGCALYSWPSWKTSSLVHYHTGIRLSIVRESAAKWVERIRK